MELAGPPCPGIRRGPALYAAAAMITFARELHFADYLEANLQEVGKWLRDEPGAFDWTNYVRLALGKGGANPNNIRQRQDEMRKKITRLLSCNWLDALPVAKSRLKYGFVSAL